MTLRLIGGAGAGRRAGFYAFAAAALFAACIMYTRTGTEVLIGVADAVFLAQVWRRRCWAWLKRAECRLAAAFWAWVMVCSLPLPALGLHGHGAGAVVQAALLGRYFLFTAAVAVWVAEDRAARAAVFGTLAASALFIALGCWEQYLTGTNFLGDPRWNDGALTGPFHMPRAGPQLVLILFPALLPPLAALLEQPRRVWRGLGVLLGMAALATMALIGQRMPMLLTLLGLVVAAAWQKRLRRPLLAAAVAAFVVVAATPFISPPTFQKLVVHFSRQMTHFWQSDYGQIYIRATAMGVQHPLTGLGFDGFRAHCHDAAYQRGIALLGVPAREDSGPAGCNIHPHNHYLEALTEAGVPGLLLFTALVLAVLRAVAGTAGTGGPEAAAARSGCFIAVLLAFWPFASTSALFTLPNAGWIFLVAGAGLGLAEAAAHPAAVAADRARVQA